MIPLKLKLTNFLSYRETAELDFTGIDLACIAGVNGAGKSSVLDAMTWALFGKSRSRSDDDIVNRQAARDGDTAEIQFDFELSNVVYRILRRKRFGRSLVVEFQVATDYDKEEWKSLSRAKRRETDTAIEEVLGMNYDTFSNASFLLQGQADEFTTKTSGQRKEILADLLGVTVWNSYRDAAASRRKQHETQVTIFDAHIGEIMIELAEEDARKEALDAKQADHQIVIEQKESKEQLLTLARRADEAIQQQKKAVSQASDDEQRERLRLDKLRQQQAQQTAERDEHSAVLEQEEQIKADFASWQQIDADIRAHQERANRYNQIRQEMQPLEMAITAETGRLKEQLRNLQQRASQIAAMTAEQDPLGSQIKTQEEKEAQIGQQLDALAETERNYQEKRDQFQQATADQRVRQQELDQLEKDALRISHVQQEMRTLTEQQNQAAGIIEQLSGDLAELEQLQAEISTQQQTLSACQAEQPLLKNQMDTLKERMDTLGSAEGPCPLCGQELTDEHKHAVIEQLQTEGKSLGDQWRNNRTQIPQLEKSIQQKSGQIKRRPQIERDLQNHQQRHTAAVTKIAELEKSVTNWQSGGQTRLDQLGNEIGQHAAELAAEEKQLQELSTTLNQKPQLENARLTAQRERSRLDSRLVEINRAITDWDQNGQGQLAAISVQLESGQILPEKAVHLADLNGQLEAVGYDQAAHTAARTAAEPLEQAPSRHQAWQRAADRVEIINQSLEQRAGQITEQEKVVVESGARLTAAQETLSGLTAELDSSGEADFGRYLANLEEEAHQLREAEIKALRLVSQAEQQLAALDAQRKRKKNYEEQRSEATLQIQRLRMIEKACGRDGVQGLLIEQALPEIEDAANELLDRLTDGQMRVEFETQKVLKSKKGATAETLDIRISDAAGTRPYENYSGGEQFRVNFAIRIALSQILAKRAGAKLQTLVIDEGFGSQDPTGRQRLIEAINAIRADFKRVLVITHIAELRDAFPNRIEIHKTPTGSQIQVN